MFGFLQQRKHRKERAREIYAALVDQSRNPVFYQKLGVPDNVDGRFDMISLHCAILILRLGKAKEAKLSQSLFDVFFKTMDRSLREMGVGDLGVPKHMKRMMKGFNGRLINYKEAVENNDKKELQNVLFRNAYGTVKEEEIDQNSLSLMADYVMRAGTMKTTEPEFPTIIEERQKNAA